MNYIKAYSTLLFQIVVVTLALSGLACARASSNYLFNKEYPPLPPPPAGLYCRHTHSFIQFGSLCTLGSQIYPNGSVHLTAYDLGCNLIGENPRVPAGRLASKGFGFNSQLKYVIAIDKFKIGVPPSFKYDGKTFGSRFFECWTDNNGVCISPDTHCYYVVMLMYHAAVVFLCATVSMPVNRLGYDLK